MKRIFSFCAIMTVLAAAAFGVTPSSMKSPVTHPGADSYIKVSSEVKSNHLELLNRFLFSRNRIVGEETLSEIEDSGDTLYVAGLIDALRYRRDFAGRIGGILSRLTGVDLAPFWPDWVEWAGLHPEIKSFPEYPAWKSRIFSAIDPNFLRFVHPEMIVDPNSRVEEIVWGGVRVDGIPALDNPKMIDPSVADYLISYERVFGVSINGDTRAYPARFLDWHEMFNDVVGGEAVSLAY